MTHFIVALLFGLAAYLVAQALVPARNVVYIVIGVVVFLLVLYGTGVVL